MSLPANRVGATRGPNGTTLDDILLALQGLNTKLQQLIDRPEPTPVDLSAITNVLGTRADCSTGESIVGLLCRLNDSVNGTPAPAGPAFRCGDVFQGGYWVASSWLPTAGSRLNSANAFYADWSSEIDNPAATVASLSLEGDSTAFPTLIPGIIPRTICMSAYTDGGISFIGVDRYNAVDQTYHDSSILGTIDFSDPWTTGVTYNVDPDYVYRFYMVMPEGVTAPASGSFLFYTEGALG